MDTVYVDGSAGTNHALCGRARTAPCQDLGAGVSKAKPSGTVIVIGDHHLQQSIVLSKSINIITDTTKQGRIISDGSADVAFIRKRAQSFKVTLMGIHFSNISLFNIQGGNNPVIEIDSIERY